MEISKRTFLRATVFTFAIICFLLSGCQLFTAGKKKLNEYCPGLKVDIDNVSWSDNGPTEVIIVGYDRSFDKRVETYFADKNNGFLPDKGRSYSDVKSDDKPEIDDDDAIVSKTIDKGKTTAKVIFDESTRKIIIIETMLK